MVAIGDAKNEDGGDPPAPAADGPAADGSAEAGEPAPGPAELEDFGPAGSTGASGAAGESADPPGDPNAAPDAPPNDDPLADAPPAEDQTAEDQTADNPLAPLQAEVADLKDKLLRAVAETENLRRRSAREVEDARKYAMTGFARDVLSVADNLRRALDALPADGADGDPNPLLAGIELTERELKAVMERHGIAAIEALGAKLDPNLHQAMVQLETGEAEPGTVVQVMQTGYTLAGRLLRPAMVAVAKAPAAGSEPGAGDTGVHIDTEA